MAKGMVFDIQRFSVNDGPGIRTTAFLKGCPLACRWCHNPEGRCDGEQIRFFANKCVGCGRCTKITGLPPSELAGVPAEQWKNAAEACPVGALIICGLMYTPEDLTDVLARDDDFYGNGGGVTFSGGEPTAQPEFLSETLELCREHGFHTALDTCGYTDPNIYRSLLSLCDLVLFDIKGMDEETHHLYTGVGNSLILSNFRQTAESGIPIWVRIPLINGLTAADKQLNAIADFLIPYQTAVKKVTMMPYHSFGNTKYPTLGITGEQFPMQEEETVRRFERIFAQRGYNIQR